MPNKCVAVFAVQAELHAILNILGHFQTISFLSFKCNKIFARKHHFMFFLSFQKIKISIQLFFAYILLHFVIHVLSFLCSCKAIGLRFFHSFACFPSFLSCIFPCCSNFYRDASECLHNRGKTKSSVYIMKKLPQKDVMDICKLDTVILSE